MFLEHALQYAARGWFVFPLKPRGKEPLTEHGFKDATQDPALIEAWWRRWPDANVGVATGASGLVVLDIDGPIGRTELAALNVTCPKTLAATTGRLGGVHLYYRGVAKSTQIKGEHLDTRGNTGYVVVYPSVHPNGTVYRWANQEQIAPVPEWVAPWAAARKPAGRAGNESPTRRPVPDSPSKAPEKPEWLKGTGAAQSKLAERTLAVLEAVPWSAHEEARLRAALACIPADIGGAIWASYGGALHDLRWIMPDDEDRGLTVYDDWSRTSTGVGAGNGAYRGRGDLERRWESFGRRVGARVTVASIFAHAREAGWDGRVPEQGEIKQINGVHALPQALTQVTAAPIVFPDTDKAGNPKATCTNAAVAIRGLGITCQKDAFHEKFLVGGQPIAQWAGDLSDEAVLVMRRLIKQGFGFDPGGEATRDAAIQECLEHQFDPVLDYLDGLAWDGRERIGAWVVDYLGSPRTRLNCEVGRLLLVAAVRRAREPGCKFDQIVVLEGDEGSGKSSAIKLLAGAENFSDQHVLAASDREQQEAVTGVWLHEIAELTGMKRTDVERVKQFASRTEDRARPAFGRFRRDLKRRSVFVATTNEPSYLKSETGNRRFWPVKTGRIDADQLAVDRDQLWAEAAHQEEAGASLVLDPKLWSEAGEAQRDRLEYDVWEEAVGRYLDQKRTNKTADDCSVYECLITPPLKLNPDQINQIAQNRVAKAFNRLGLEKYRKREGDQLLWRYRPKQ